MVRAPPRAPRRLAARRQRLAVSYYTRGSNVTGWNGLALVSRIGTYCKPIHRLRNISAYTSV